MGALPVIGCPGIENNLATDKFAYDTGDEIVDEYSSPVITPRDTGHAYDGCIALDSDKFDDQLVALSQWEDYNTSYPSTAGLHFCGRRSNAPEEGRMALEFPTKRIESFEVRGYWASVPPTTDLRIVGLDWTDTSEVDVGDPHHYPNRGNYYSGYLTATAEAVPPETSRYVPTWRASGTSAADLGGLNDCVPDCRWRDIYLEIFDYTRAELGQCADYANWVTFCPVFAPMSTARTARSARCIPGRGEFMLVPQRRIDRNRDGLRSYVFRPMMLDGFGTLTADATITDVSSLAQQSFGLQIVTAETWDFGFDQHDRLIATDEAIAAVHSAVEPGTCLAEGAAGGAPFILEATDGLLVDQLGVNMSWTCDRFLGSELLDLSPGYTFSLGDLGCGLAAPQSFTIRSGANGGRTMTVEPYGVPDARVVVALRETGGQKRFDYLKSGLRVKGYIDGTLGGSGIQLVIETVKFRGNDICTPDIQTLVRDPD